MPKVLKDEIPYWVGKDQQLEMYEVSPHSASCPPTTTTPSVLSLYPKNRKKWEGGVFIIRLQTTLPIGSTHGITFLGVLRTQMDISQEVDTLRRCEDLNAAEGNDMPWTWSHAGASEAHIMCLEARKGRRK
jgi:hypothetical protein